MLLWLEIKNCNQKLRDEASSKIACDDREVDERITLKLMLGKWVVWWKVSETSQVRILLPVRNFSNGNYA
jgi:hypothetical protein